MKTRESVLTVVKDLISEKFGCNVNEVKEESNINTDFVSDSLDILELVMDLEKEFNIAIPDKEAEFYFNNNKTVSEIVDFLMKKVN